MTDTDWIEIGRVVAPQGVKGEVRIYPSSDFPERFLEPGTRWLQRPKAQSPEPVELVRGRSLDGKGLYVVQFAGIGDRDQAETLRGCALLVPASDRPDLEEGEFYVADLVGLRVILQATGVDIGVVTDIYEAGNDLLEVTLHPELGQGVPAINSDITSEGTESLPEASPKPEAKAKPKPQKPKKVLVPFVESIVPTVDLAQGCLYLDPPDGLL